jgi:hypothetical protein
MEQGSCIQPPAMRRLYLRATVFRAPAAAALRGRPYADLFPDRRSLAILRSPQLAGIIAVCAARGNFVLDHSQGPGVFQLSPASLCQA